MNPDLMLSENKQHIGKSILYSENGVSCSFINQQCVSPCPGREIEREPALTVHPSSENFLRGVPSFTFIIPPQSSCAEVNPFCTGAVEQTSQVCPSLTRAVCPDEGCWSSG